MTDTRTKVGHGLAKVLRLNLDENGPAGGVTRGESVFSVATADSYIEDEPTVGEWLRETTPSGKDILHWFLSLFPFTQWILKYNWQWFVGDLIAGITIGAVVVPQGMGYAKLALLSPQYGLYSAFMGVLVYWFFGTSKDITIGPVAVMSLLTGDIITKVMNVDPNADPVAIAQTLAILGGAIVFVLGFIRLGWLVDFISLTAVSAFITGSAINIIAGQIGNLFGIATYFNTRASPYIVIINSLKNLHRSRIDAAMGLTALFMLYFIRFVFNQLAKRQPNRRKLWFFCNTLRTVFVILLYTLISYLVNRNLPDHNQNYSEFFILGTVPRGFTAAGVPGINTYYIKQVASSLPAVVIVLLIEHISIAKSFGRVNNYTINPSQELVAIGVTNLLAPFLGGYPSTGSFSRTAIKSKAGVRTPFAGVITAIVVLLAIYALPAVFFYIPSASLSAVIIHAVGDLITPPNTVYQFWRISPLEVVIFFVGVIVMVFTTIEDGVYVVICTSVALLLYRIFKSPGRFLGKVTVHSVVGDGSLDDIANKKTDDDLSRDVFLPINAEDGTNPLVRPQHPAPGVFIYRFTEGFNYPNASHYLDYMVREIQKECQRTTSNAYMKPGDRPWNDPAPRHAPANPAPDTRPVLKAVIIDMSSVNNVDVTSVQTLLDVRNQLDRFAAPDKVQWHFAHISNRWTKRALAAAGFGFPTQDDGSFSRWKPIFSVADLGGSSSAAAANEQDVNQFLRRQSRPATKDEEHGPITVSNEIRAGEEIEKTLRSSVAYESSVDNGRAAALVASLHRPFFHVDIASALKSVLHNSDVLAGQIGEVQQVDEKGATLDVHT